MTGRQFQAIAYGLFWNDEEIFKFWENDNIALHKEALYVFFRI